MRLGIDFGTTRTVVAAVDRGNYPVVTFEDADGDAHPFVPSVIANRGGAIVHGFEAELAAAEGFPALRSVKRLLATPTARADLPIAIGDVEVPLLDLLTGFLAGLRSALRDTSSLGSSAEARAALDAHDDVCVAAVPAHAHSGQRLLTLEAFRQAGFTVERLVNEPSAAGFEYTHHRAATLNSKRSNVLVFDLGGGTFDASLVSVRGEHHDVEASLGRADLGGDDFDAALAEAACARTDVAFADRSPAVRDRLLRDAREAKERLAPQSKRILLEVDGDPVTVPVEAFTALATPLVERAIETMRPLADRLQAGAHGDADVAGISVVGGASMLPLIPRMLRAEFGRRVHRSPVPSSSTAIGLAIAADRDSGFELRDRTALGFGVFREADAGERVAFDAVFAPGTPLPPAGERTVHVRRYLAAHNIGAYRFVEYSQLDLDRPTGLVFPAGRLRVPFDSDTASAVDLDETPIRRSPGDGGPLIEEYYELDADGVVTVRIENRATGGTYAPTLHPPAAARVAI